MNVIDYPANVRKVQTGVERTEHTDQIQAGHHMASEVEEEGKISWTEISDRVPR